MTLATAFRNSIHNTGLRHKSNLSGLTAWVRMGILRFILIPAPSWEKSLCLMTSEAGQNSKRLNSCAVMPNFSKMGWVPFPEISRSRTFAEVSFWCHSDRYYIKPQGSQKRAQDFRALLNLTIQMVYSSGRNNHMVGRGQAGMLASINAIFSILRPDRLPPELVGGWSRVPHCAQRSKAALGLLQKGPPFLPPPKL